MRPWTRAVSLALALAVGVGLVALGFASGRLVPPFSGPPASDHVLYAQGEVIRVVTGPVANPGPPTTIDFTVPPTGARLVGTVSWDHGSAVFVVGPVGALWGCPAEFLTPEYRGPAYVQSFNETLSPGAYEFGAVCAGWGNATVTSTVQLLPLG